MEHAAHIRKIPTIDPDAYNIYDYPVVCGTPERNLLMAMMERAILDFVGNQEQEIEDAREWLFEDQEQIHRSWSFEWICEQLGLNQGKVLDTIKKMPKRGDNRTAPWYWSNYGSLVA